jgi:hypothetical protein
MVNFIPLLSVQENFCFFLKNNLIAVVVERLEMWINRPTALPGPR